MKRQPLYKGKNYRPLPTIGNAIANALHPKFREYTHCYYCAEKLGPDGTVVKRAIKPRNPNRWVVIGKCCPQCANERNVWLDPWS